MVSGKHINNSIPLITLIVSIIKQRALCLFLFVGVLLNSMTNNLTTVHHRQMTDSISRREVREISAASNEINSRELHFRCRDR